jgi:hypothetical protein
MKRFYDFLSGLISLFNQQVKHARNGIGNALTINGTKAPFLISMRRPVLIVASLFMLILWLINTPNNYRHLGNEIEKITWTLNQAVQDLLLPSEKHWVCTIKAHQQQWLGNTGVCIQAKANLGQTSISLSAKPAVIQQNRSIRKVVGIHPENNDSLDAEMIFTYSDAELNGLEESKLILYSSSDNGVTWIPHINSLTDAATNSIRLSGIRHFSLWTAALQTVQGPGCVTTGIGAWWRADNGCSIASWSDFSGNGYHATAVNQPVFNTTGANFNPMVTLTNDYYKYTVGIFKNSPGIVNAKVFAVTIPVNGANNHPWGEYTTNGHNYSLLAPHSNNYTYHDAPYGHRVFNVFTTNGGQYGVPNIIAGERTQNNMSIRTNGKVQNFAGSYGGTFTSHTNLNFIGAHNGSPTTNGSVAEVIVYRDASSMNATQVQKIESYLALKYGITLDQTTPRDYLAGSGAKMWDAAVNGAFKHNIAGIGREDCQSLHQKQSKSINPGQFVTIATGSSIEAGNADNTASVAADNAFLVWADNNMSASTSVAVSGVNVTDRMSRVWRVDKTNWTDQTITFKAAGYANRYLLIHNTSATFATAPNQEILLNANGEATFNSSLLPDGAYFSIGNLVKGPACISAGIGAWWRADQECSTTSWVDYSGNGYNAAAVNSPVFNQTGANYNPFVNLTSDYYQYQTGIFKNAPGIVNSKVFSVVIPVNGAYTEPWGEYTTNGYSYHIHAPYANDYIYHDAPYGYRINASFAAQGGQYNVPNIISGERTSTNMSLRTNGRVLNQPGNYTGTFTSHTQFNYVGAVYGLPTSNAGLAEVIVYRDASAMSGTDVQKIESYLALKYGITLDQSSGQDYLASGGSKMWDATVNAAFRYNIAGLGRDDCQLLHQKQSRSVNSAQFITFATGSGIAASNAANTTSVAANNSYLVWGDNNGSITSQVSVSATNVTDRMSRVWRVDKTNWTDQTITFQAVGYANRYLLIHNTSASFATAPNQEILLDGEGKATFNSSLLPDGAYFTIGGVFQGPGCVNAGIGAWWRADQFCSNTEWKDFSGNDHTATNVGSPTFSSTGANYNPLVKFNSNHYKYTDGIFKDAPGIVNSKVFTVVIPVSGQYSEPWGEYTTNGHSYHIHAPHANGIIYHDAPFGHRIQTGFSAQGGQFNVPNIIAGERTPTNMSIRTNGKVLNQAGNYNGTFTSHTTLNYIGAVHGLASSGGSGLAEVIIYRDASAMTAQQVQRIESYLALKYGITLDQTSPQDYLASNGSKMWDATAHIAHRHNVAGLGRDNCQLLHQKQSKSVNSKQFITFALGDSIASSNAGNPNNIINDRSFLVWGDDNGGRFTSVAVSATNVTARMARVWRVDKTNWADQNITIQAEGYPNRYLLIHNTSSTFATAPHQEILLDDAGKATFSSSLLPDGAYFTIGDALKGPGCVNAGIGAWWKADYQMGATFWDDYSGNAKDAFNVGSPSPQTTGANYNPYVKFFSNHYKYTEGIFKDAPGIVNSKVFTVVVPLAGQYTEPWGEYTTNGHNYHFHAPHLNGNIYHDAPFGHRVFAGFTAQGGQIGVPNIIAGERTQTNMNIRTNGKVFNQAGTYSGTFTSHTDLNYIGASHGLATSGGSGVAEVIVYRDGSTLTAADVQKIESYLALKYGITLDQTTARDYLSGDGVTKMWDATANGAFKFNIAGIGKDLCQQLHQKQSKSVNPKQFIVFALGDSIASANNNNPKTVTNDKSFLVWADDNGSRFTTTAVTATNVTQRMTRVWKVDKTNWSDQAITFQAQGYPNRYLLIHNSSATFATAPDQEILLDGEGKATFSSNLLPDGAFFTIGDAILGPGCVNAGVGAWWKSDYQMTDTYWNDYSGNDKGTSQVGALTTFVSGANFNPMVKFNGGYYNFLEDPIFKDNPGVVNMRVFAVTVPVNGQHTIPWSERASNGHNIDLLAPWGDNTIYFDAPFGYRVTQTFSTQGGQYGAPNLFVGVRTQSNMAIRLQGKQIVSNNGSFTGNFTSPTHAHLGARVGVTGSTGNTGLAEVIVYRDAGSFTATDLQKVESYLALKYGITLDQTTARDYLASNGTTKIWDATANATWRYNIAGIGKDLCTQLHQKQSKSVNSGQFITFALGSNIPVANAENQESVTNDRSFFVWGDNNGTLQASISVNASSVSERSGRIWRVDKTNWADQDITIHVQGYPNRTLLIDNDDPTFSGVPDQEIQLDGAGYATFNSSLLPDGAYFTLGNILIGPGCVNVGIASWFDATEMDEGLMVNGAGWADKSGWHRDMYQINGGQDPEVFQSKINFNKGVVFDGDDVVYQPSYGTSFTEGEVFAVGKVYDNLDRGPLFDFGGPTGQGAIHYNWSNRNVYEGFGTNDRVGYSPLTNSITDNAPGLTVTGAFYDQRNWNIYNTASKTNDWFSGFNGLAKAVRTTNTPTFLTSFGNTNGNMHIGWREGFFIYGEISEVIHYNRKLTATERQKVHSYLGLKYGITLDQSSPYNYVASNGTVYWDGTANAGFKNNIAGLGRDNCTNLHQKQSKSANAGQFITMAIGTEIAVSNAANAGVIANDRSFLVWGDDNGSTAIPVSVSGSNVTERMTRVWRVDKTNWADQNITFKAQGYPNRYLLIHNSSASFATAPDQEIALDSVGQATFSTGLLPDGAYFTIGDAVRGPGCVNLGAQLWLKSDFGLSNGATWSDFSGNDVAISQNVAGEQPAYLAGDVNTNFNPALLFGADDNLNIGVANGLLTNGGGTIVAAVMHNNIAATWGDIYNQDTDDPTLGKYAGVGNYKVWDNGVHTANDVPLNFIQNRNHVAIYDYGSTANSWSAHLDGLTHNITHAALPSIDPGTAYIGGENTAETWLGNIYEIAVYNRELTTAELKRVNSYLALKYGITLNQTAATDYLAGDGITKMWDASTNATWRYNIAGLGRDNCSTLHQKQSRSANSGQFITLAIGDSIAINNALNPATITNDKSFLVWGDDNGSSTTTVPVTATNVTERMTRVWRVDKTNWADQNISFRAQGFGNRYLIISNSSATFTTVDQEIPLDGNGRATFNSSLIPDGAYFTIGDAIKGPGCVNAGVKMWFRPDYDITVSSGKVAQWADYSGNDVVATQTNTTRQPTYSASMLNFNPGATFAGGSDGQVLTTTLNSMSGNSPYTIFAVHKPDNASSNLFAIGNPVTNQNIAYHPSYLGNRYLYHFNDDLIPGAYRSGWQLNSFRYEALASGTDRYVYDEGKQIGANATNVQNVPVNPTFSLGGYNNRTGAAGEEYDGDLVEFVVYSQALSTADRNRVESYLAIKYGITLDQTTATDYIAGDGTTKMWDASANGAYNNDIAGIGRDACQALYQKQSKSINADALITIGNGQIVADNASNTSSLADKSFLMWANNNGALTWQTAESPTARLRLGREWKVDETGTIGTIKIQVPDNSSSLASKLPGESGVVYLLTDADGDFSSGATEVNMTLNGNNWEADVDFSDGQYFTFGTQVPPAPGCVLPNLVVWLKSNAGVALADSITVSGWQDQSLGVMLAEQSNSAQRPKIPYTATGTLNFNPGISFDNTDDHMLIPNAGLVGLPTGNTSRTAFIVGKLNTNTGQDFAFGYGAAGVANQSFEMGNNANRAWYENWAGGYQGTVGAFYSGRTIINSWKHDNTANPNSTGYINGVSDWSQNIAALNTALGSTPFYIGRHNDNAAPRYWDGFIGEIILYDKALTAVEMQRINTYLSVKYGITYAQDYLSGDGTTIWDVGATGGYDNDIAGIGRDDCQGLNQKQSKSVNTDALLTVGNGNLVVGTNAENTASFSADESFLLWGNNNGSVAWQLAEAPANRQRLTREWRVYESGAVASVKIRVPDNSSSLSSKMPAEVSTIYLLTDADGDFSSGATETTMTQNGSDWECNIDLTNEQYFTFATNVPAAPGGVVNALGIWLKANDAGSLVLTGNNVDQWTDRSQNAFVFNDSDGNAGPDLINGSNGRFNFNPYLDFGIGGTRTLQNTTAANTVLTTQQTMFGVMYKLADAQTLFAMDIGAQDGGIQMNTLDTRGNTSDYYYKGSVSNVPLNEVHIVGGGDDVPGDSQMDVYYDGKLVQNSTAGTGSSTAALTAGTAMVGRGLNAPFTGTAPEIIAYTRKLTPVEFRRVGSYLALKYGLTLDQSTAQNYIASDESVIWDASANGVYKYDIAGIGRDDASSQDQKQSKSINSDALVTIGNGNIIAGTNALNTSTLGFDKSFLIWANNDGAIAWQTTEAPSSRQRLTREWKISETGVVSSVKIRVPDNSSSLATKLPAETSNLFLLIDDDGDFSSGATEIPMAPNGADWEVDQDLLDGKYFTFATETCNPLITTNPVDVTLCAGGNATFMTTAFGSGLTYQWQENTGSGWNNIAGATSTSYTKMAVTGAMSGYQYRVIVSNSCPPSDTSTVATMTVNTPPAITTQPLAVSVCDGAIADFEVIATGSALTYQWQENTGSGWADIVGATSFQYSVNATASMSGYQYRVVISGTCSPTATSNIATLTVNTLPEITDHPDDVAVCAGMNAVFSVIATGTGLTYQWQENTGSGFMDIASATSATYTKTGTTGAMNGYQYRVVVSGACTPPVTSNVAVMTVNTLPAITAQPTAQTVCEGNDATFSVVATGAGLTYQWEENTGSGWNNIVGATSASYTKTATTAAMNGYQYRVSVSGTCTPPVTSAAVLLSVNTAPAITVQPSAITVCEGANATFSVTATGAGLTYQWEENTGSGWNSIAGATSASYTKMSTTVAMSGYQYRVVVSGTCTPPVTSSAVLLTVNTLPAITAQPTAQTVCEGNDATFSVVATGAGLMYQWEENTGAGWNNIAGATSASYTKTATTATMNGYQYRVVVSGTCTPPVTSSAVLLTVNTAPAITVQPAAVTVCEGANATFSVTATGAGLIYQWEENTGSGWNSIAGATSASYTQMSTTVAMSGYQYRVVVSGTCSSPVTSGAVTLTVNTLPTITTQPVPVSVCAGANANFSVTASGTGITYQWQEDTGSGFSNLASETNPTFIKVSTTPSMNGYKYRVIVSGACTPSVTSNEVILTINTAPAITTQPVAQTVCEGADATFTVAATGTGLMYQWQENSGSGFVNIAGATSASYTKANVNTSMNGYQYQVVISGVCTPPVTSSIVGLTVNMLPAISMQPVSVTVCAGSNATFSVTATGTGIMYQWQENTGLGWNNIAGATGASYTKSSTTASMDGYQYRVIVSGACTPSVTSNAVLLTVNTAPAISTPPASITVCAGNDATFSVVATGTGLTYQWEENTGTGFAAIPGATAASYTKVATTSGMNGYQYRVVISGTCTPSVTSIGVTLTVNSLPTINTHPISQTLCEGSNAVFSVSASGSSLTYQWQENIGSGFVNIPGATASLYIKPSITPALNGYQYRVIVSGACIPSVTSNTALLTVNTAPAITTHPASVTTCEGANVIFSAVATGSGLTYQWQENTGSGWTDISGANSASYTKTGITIANNGYQYRVVVSGACTPPATSNAATLTVTTPPAITSQPISVTICAGANATFSVTASGTNLAYQWQVNDGFGFVDIPGATNPTYTKVATPASYNGYQYRVIIGGDCPPGVTSNIATITITPGPSIVDHPMSQTACVASNATFNVVASGPGLTYQWQEDTGSGFINISGATADSYTKTGITAMMDGYKYRVLVTGTCPPTIASNAATLTVEAPPAITTQPVNTTLCEGNDAMFSVVASGNGLTYQWQENTGSGFVNIAGATATSYTKAAVTAAMNGYQYRVVVTGACAPPATSNAAALTVNVAPSISIHPVDVSACAGNNATFTATASGTTLTYQWQEDAGSGFMNIAGATSISYTKMGVTASMNGFQYRVVVSGACTPPATSNPATLTVNTAPTIVAQPTAQTTCTGEDAIFSVMATGSGLSYQWQENTGSGFVNIPGATSDIYTKTAVTPAMNGYSYRVSINGICSPSVTSVGAALTVIAQPAITVQPVAVTLCAGGNATFNVMATGDALTYQWQENTGSGFADIVGATSSSYTKTGTTGAMDGYQYRVVVSGTCAPPATSNIALLTVNTAPAITTQPLATTVCAGDAASFSVTATGSSLTYQWQENTGSGFVDISGATASTYSIMSPSASMNGYQYRVVVSGACLPPVTSVAAVLTVNTAPSISSQPASVTTPEGTDATFTVTAAGTGISYQWQEDAGSGFVNIAGATSSSYTKTAVTIAMNGYEYRVIISGACMPSVTSADALLTVTATAPALAIKAYLGGNYDEPTSRMSDKLRVMNLIPNAQPYNGAQYSEFAYAGAETIGSGVLNVSGDNAIVDWVLVELRDKNNPASIVARKAALIQRDGDVVSSTDGASAVTFTGTPADDYYVALRHRNHLGVMTMGSLSLSGMLTNIDFTDPMTANHQLAGPNGSTHAQQTLSNNKRVLWSGNFSNTGNTGNRVIYQGNDADTDEVYYRVLLDPGNINVVPNYIVTAYDRADGNLDGNVIYQGADADVDVPFYTVFLFPDNINALPNYIIFQQIP